MARLIQDIKPVKSTSLINARAIQDRALKVHQATNIPKLAERSRQKFSSFDMVYVPVRKIKPRPIATPRSIPKAKPAEKAQQKKPIVSARRRLLDFIQYPLIAAVAIGLAYSSLFGQLLILALLLISLIRKLPNRYSFAVAIIFIVCIPLFQVIKQTGISQNCAIYAFEALVAGTIVALFELWHERKQPSLATGSK
jgi:hypothetical protein